MHQAEFEKKLLDGIDALSAKIVALEKHQASEAEVKKALADLTAQVADLRRSQLAGRTLRGPRLPGQVSEECARHLGALACAAGMKQGKLRGDAAEALVKDILGAEARTALSTTDIPLPTTFAGEVAELVSEFGAARQYGTVFPLGGGTVKLPRLKTSTAFGLLAIATAVTEKSPQLEMVTFTAEKWGGLVRLPAEIDQDSVVAMGQFLARYAAREMAKIEDVVFFTADGTSTYASIEGLTKAVVTNSKTVALAATKTKYSDVDLAKLRELRTTVDAAALGMSAYYMHPTFEQRLSALNASGDKPYVAAGVQGASLDGFPIRWIDTLPAYSTSANAGKVFALFGDVSYHYLGVRRGVEIATSTEAAFATDEILTRAIERFTIGLMATGAVGGLITAAS